MGTALTSHTFGLAPARRYRAASLRQVAQQRAWQWARGVWRALEAFGQRRAHAELLRAAALYQGSRPELAATLRRLAEPQG